MEKNFFLLEVNLLSGALGGGTQSSVSLAVEPPDFIKSIIGPGWGTSLDNLSDPELPKNVKINQSNIRII